MKKREVSRDAIVKALIASLEPLDYVQAFYEGGAIAFNRLDKWSDIDLYAVVDDRRVDDAFGAVESALKSLSPIKQKYAVQQLPWPGVSQAFYKLERTSDYLLIDLAIIKQGSPEMFLERQIHGEAVFYFNKAGIRAPPLNKEELAMKLQQRLERLKDRFALFNIFVQKEINRGNYLEALLLYHNITVGSVVDVLRILYSPLHYDFKTRYLKYELPKQITRKLDRLYFVKNSGDLGKKYREATKWFNEICDKKPKRSDKGTGREKNVRQKIQKSKVTSKKRGFQNRTK